MGRRPGLLLLHTQTARVMGQSFQEGAGLWPLRSITSPYFWVTGISEHRLLCGDVGGLWSYSPAEGCVREHLVSVRNFEETGRAPGDHKQTGTKTNILDDKGIRESEKLPYFFNQSDWARAIGRRISTRFGLEEGFLQ
jgi:hypothetical protein